MIPPVPERSRGVEGGGMMTLPLASGDKEERGCDLLY